MSCLRSLADDSLKRLIIRLQKCPMFTELRTFVHIQCIRLQLDLILKYCLRQIRTDLKFLKSLCFQTPRFIDESERDFQSYVELTWR